MRSVFFAAALLLAPTALAQTTPPAAATTPRPPTPVRAANVTALDTAGLIAALLRAGFAAEAKTEDGQTYVIAKHGAQPFQAFLTNCRTPNVGCTDIELFAGFSGQRIAWERINGWNARTRFTRAFLDEKRDPALQMDVSVQGGVSQDGLKTSLTTWGAGLETFSLFLAARVPPVGARAAAPVGDPPPIALPKR